MHKDQPTPSNRLNFTKRDLDRLPLPTAGVAYHYDTEAKGLAISVGKTGRKSFLLYRKINGRPERIKIGRYPDVSIGQARDTVTALNADIARDINPAEAMRDRRKEITLAEFFKEYYKRHSLVHKVSHKEDIEKFERHINTNKYGVNLAKLRLSDITRAQLISHHAKMGNIPTTANRVIALISSMYSRAIQWGDFDGNHPCRGMDKFKEKSRSRFVLPDEMPRLMLAMEHESNELVRDFVKLALYTGARRSNVLAMQWPDVHLERREWQIAMTKNGEPQTVLLTPEAIEVLERRKKAAQGSSSLFVFPGSGKSGHLVEPRGAWERMLARSTALGLVEALAEKATAKTFDYQLALEEAVDFPVQTIERYTPLAEKHGLHLKHYEMRDLKIHDLRRTLGSWLASSGTSLPIIGKVLNHKTPEATKVYARLMVAPVRNAMEDATAAMRRTGEV